MTISDLLRDARAALGVAGCASPDLDATLLLAEVLGVPKHRIRTEPSREVGDADATRFRGLVAERARRRPMSQILGRVEFRSLEFEVTDKVLAPRPETEDLVERAIAAAARIAASDGAPGRAPRIAEIGAGSGCNVVAIAVACPAALLFASDVSGAALAVAARNAARHGVADRVRLLRGDMAAPLREYGPFDVVLSNPPYVRRSEAGELDPEVLWEPACAVFCDGEPREVYARVAAEAAAVTAPGGMLLCELPGDDPAVIVAAVAGLGAWRDVSVAPDLAGNPRVLSATRNS